MILIFVYGLVIVEKKKCPKKNRFKRMMIK